MSPCTPNLELILSTNQTNPYAPIESGVSVNHLTDGTIEAIITNTQGRYFATVKTTAEQIATHPNDGLNYTMILDQYELDEDIVTSPLPGNDGFIELILEDGDIIGVNWT
jgi:hypothetical protein